MSLDRGANWVAGADAPAKGVARLRPMSADEFAPGGPGAVEARRRHIEAMGAEWRTYRQSAGYQEWLANQRSESLRLAYQLDPSFRPY